ncbi:hypothetical protein [Saliphagus infecundisoli]|uniref:HTH iclR-type domain-containing protein n=1 Tax=Saliphagus infecundisoli TaxID=1849069 RepID=A0ABD5QAL7_9EURY|nr:hypothetical protein [Saliphagus infecundisoli]
MAESIVAAARDRMPLSEIVGAVAIAVVLSSLGYEETAIVPLLGVVLRPIATRAFDALDLGLTSLRILFGIFVAVAGASALSDGGESVWLGAVLLVAGSWLVLDTLYEYRHGEPTEPVSVEKEEDEPSMAEMQALGAHGRWVLETLQEADRPLTAGEIRTRTGLTEDELADVFEILEGNGTVEPMGTGYVIDESAMGLTGFVRSIGGRLLRPVRLFGPS